MTSTGADLSLRKMPGQVWRLTNDAQLRLSEDLDGGIRTGKARPLALVTAPEYSSDPDVPYVLCMPVTSRTSDRPSLGRFEVQIPAGVAGLHSDSVAPVFLLQPVSKLALEKHIGDLPTDLYEAVMERLADFLAFPDSFYDEGEAVAQ